MHLQPPRGFERPGHVLLLKRALYGLKESPMLWHAELTSTLESLGLVPVPGIQCLYANSSLLVFFYVDDIVLAYRRRFEQEATSFVNSLTKAYELNRLGDLNWFLGIKVTRDRERNALWLSQEEYIEKARTKYSISIPTKPVEVPIPPYADYSTPDGYKATADQVHAYQSRVGTVNYLATQTRPDIAKAVSVLSYSLLNPTPAHLKAADHLIQYAYSTRRLALCYQNDDKQLHFLSPGSTTRAPEFLGASDASFADDEATRRSSEGYLFKCFGGAVEWKAGRQTTVTKSSTEAELLALSHAGSALIWWNRFFKAIKLDLVSIPTLLCDNKQTLRIVQLPDFKLSSTLRHVDIHSHWLRQAARQNEILFNWVETSRMPADGLTKILPKQKHDAFVQLLGLTDIGTLPTI
jgi:hypothetical protein